MRKTPLIAIAAGGTGGHVMPALAVAEALAQRGYGILWFGTRQGPEARLVPERGYPLIALALHGFRGKSIWLRMRSAIELLAALLRSGYVLGHHRVDAVLCMGGYASVATGTAAWLRRRPLFIHEQNAIAGWANRLLRPLARLTFTTFPRTFQAGPRVVEAGLPVRSEIRALEPPRIRFGNRTPPHRLLVLGGSQGARRLNEVVPRALASWASPLSVIHQTGPGQVEETQQAYRASPVEVTVAAFLDDIAQAYAWADLVVTRAGASTIAELAVAGLPSILVPYPHAVDDHQTHNACYLVECGAARLIPDAALNPETLLQNLHELLQDRQARLHMAESARSVAHPDAVETIVSGIRRAVEGET
ncbi:undecaprenyldiphospho-muramoylpentapeptide beta-N-acetylglucosaminyltransferase [mine drainage metagenome]|uniref:Undecaprenyldiphospho-muramoylpentapeptide beta-N-acetylglucosaminyltransferase n=1 Tax=mine drainage metagenome TaxID=410659 RepID=T0YBP5_9ZZZZ